MAFATKKPKLVIPNCGIQFDIGEGAYLEKKRILILGSNGLLGTQLVPFLNKNKSFEILTHSHSSAADYANDIRDYDSCLKLLKNARPNFVINLFALTDVDKCEQQSEFAYSLNVTPLANAVKSILTEKLDIRWIQVSTDHVYNKSNSKEHEIVLLNSYARTKYLADELSLLIDSCVLRTSFFGGRTNLKKSLSDWAESELSQGKSIRGFQDIYFSPLHSSSLCKYIELVLSAYKAGVYNLGSRNGHSKFDFLKELIRIKKLDAKLLSPISYIDAGFKTPRPTDMRMDCSLFEETFDIILPTLEKEISLTS